MSETIPLLRVDDLIGTELGPSSWITVDQARIDAFAACTGDMQWIHVDQERAARESPLGGTIAHGYLTLALLAPTCQELLTARVEARQALNYGLDKVRFLAPVRAGQRVRNRCKLTGCQDRGEGRFLLTIESTLEIDGQEKPALVASTLVLLTR